MVADLDVRLADGRVLRVHDSETGDFALLWQHGSPQTGALLDPVLAAAGARGIRLLSYGRPSYGGSTPQPGRDIAAAAVDVGQIADALGIDQFATMGASGGGPHALACGALLPERVVGVVSLSGPAPFTESFDWYAGMHSDAALRAAAEGREARERFAAGDEFDPDSFTVRDWATLDGHWAALGVDAGRAGEAGPDGLIDDDVAFASPWGFDVKQVEVPVLIAQGGDDRVIPPSHGEWLMRNCPTAEFWFRPRDGHISILGVVPLAMDWLTVNAWSGKPGGPARPGPGHG
ncbi:MAG: alpha/beta hydrolase [Kibdelosporangium sp.]